MEIEIHTILQITPDPRHYNAHSVPEIAVIIPGDCYTEGVASRGIVLHEHTGGLQRITESHCAYDSLHYVLLFPLGENGWHLKVISLLWSSTLSD